MSFEWPDKPVLAENRFDLTLLPWMGEAEVRVDAANAAVETLQSEVAGAVAALTDLPAIPDLHAHWDAGSLGLVDGTRIASWLDEVSGRDAAQATAGNQPIYVANAINGRPGVYFDSSRVDRLVATIAPSNPQATVITVVKPTPATAVGFLLGSNTTVKNLFYSESSGRQRWALQVASQMFLDMLPGLGQVVTAVYDGASSRLRCSGNTATADLGALSTPSTSLTIGHRASLSGSAYDGVVCEVLWYDRALSDGEVDAIERYVGARYAIPTTKQTVWHVNSTMGDDGNTGRNAASPLKTLGRLYSAMQVSNAPLMTAYLDAPPEAPFRMTSTVQVNWAGTVRLLAASPDRPWHALASERVTSGWTDEGDGVYAHALTRSSGEYLKCWIPDWLDGDGLPTRIHVRAATQTAPAEGEFGFASNTYYLHLPGGVDPGNYAIEIVNVTLPFLANHASAVLVLEDAVIAGANTAGAQSSLGKLIARRVRVEHNGVNGFGSGTGPNVIECTSCQALMSMNDGFNCSNTTVMTLIDCEGAWNDDEGASPHGSTTLIIVGGRYHHNGSSGITAVNDSTLNLLPYHDAPVESDHNRRLFPGNGPGGDRGGVSLLNTATANVYALHSHDNPGPGVHAVSGTTWNVLGTVRSGVAEGNELPDEIA